MKGTWLAMVRGFLWVKLVGGQQERFLNAATREGITLWSIAHDRDGSLTFGVSIPDFYRLRPLLRENGSRTRILARYGLPFKMAKLSRRKTFAGGLLLFAAALFVHPQTVRYRMGQLRELYGDRLDDPDTVLALTVALG